MRPKDISRRVLARPLRSPYLPGGGARPRRRWLWILLAAWLAWVGVFSRHSLWRIATLRHDLKATTSEVARVRAEGQRLDEQLRDPQARLEHGEAVLRRQGMARPGEIVYRLGGAPDSLAH